jgi:glycosyltransferase involved in cell wall biosynthesis
VPSISVALATRNGAQHVVSQVQSILRQSVPVAEIVVSDDGSTDDTVALVEQTVGAAVPLTVLRNPVALGVTANFEQAIAACTSDIIALADQDDVWHVDRVARAVALLEGPRAPLLVHGDAVLVDATGSPLGSTLFEALEVTPHDLAAVRAGDGFRVLLRRNLATGATVMFRRAVLDLARPFPPEWVHDEWLAIVAAATGGIDVVTEPVIDYRQHGTNQIGVEVPTLRRRISRVLERGTGRNAMIAARFGILRERLGERLAPPDRHALDGKIAHESARAAMPRVRLLRMPSIARELVRGAYRRYSSRGRWDAVRDLLQPR